MIERLGGEILIKFEGLSLRKKSTRSNIRKTLWKAALSYIIPRKTIVKRF